MYSVSNITHIIVGDAPNQMYDEDESKHYIPGSITLGVSNDDCVHYDWFESILKREKNNVLFLDNYHGKLLVPKHCGVQIINSSRPISGLINFPAYLDSYDGINVMIEKESGLELIASTLGNITLNRQMVPKLIKDVKKKIPTMIGEDFDLYKYKFTKKNNSRPNILDDKYGRIADFGNIDAYCPIQVCMKYNLVAIDTHSCDINIFYENFNLDSRPSEFAILKGIRSIERDIDQAKKSEDYREIISLQKRLERLNAMKLEMTKNVRSIPEKTKTNNGSE